jgi:hypothetical protein
MKIMTLGVLFAVALMSVSGCHWRHRRWRNYHDHSYNAQPSANQLAIDQRAVNTESNS